MINKLLHIFILAFFATPSSVGQVTGNLELGESQRAHYAKYKEDELFIKLKKDVQFQDVLGTSSINEFLDTFPKLKALVKRKKVTSIARAFPVLAARNDDLSKIYLVKVSASSELEKVLAIIQKLDYIEYAEKVPLYEQFYIPNDPHYGNPSKRWHLDTISAEGAWDITLGSTGRKIAIVDDAVLLNHEDLANKIFVNTAEVPGNGIDDDNNGYIDDYAGFDVADNDGDANPPITASNSFFMHGTHVAGIACGQSNNNLGNASIGFNTSFIPVKTKSDSNTNPSALNNPLAGVEYAVVAEADVINMSWGTYAYSITSEILFDYVYAQGIICVAAAGNNSLPFIAYPANYESVIAVGASDTNDDIATFTNISPLIDVFAPGVSIWSCLAGGNDQYGYLSGTSMACPIVSGMVALMVYYHSWMGINDIRSCLKYSSDFQVSNIANNYTFYRLNAENVLNCIPPQQYSCPADDCELIANGGFEIPINSAIQNYSAFSALTNQELCSWQCYHGTNDIQPMPIVGFDHYAMGFSGGLPDSNYNEAVVSNVMNLIPGQEYQLSFDYTTLYKNPSSLPSCNYMDSFYIGLLHNNYVWDVFNTDSIWPMIWLESIYSPPIDGYYYNFGDVFNGIFDPHPLLHNYTLNFLGPQNTDFGRLVIGPRAQDDWNLYAHWLILDNISVKPVIDVQATASLTNVGPGICTDLVATGSGNVFVWDPPEYFVDPFDPNQTVCLDSTVTFYVTVYDSILGCTSSDSITISYDANVNSGSESITACSPYYWPTSGDTYTQDGTYIAIVPNQYNSDSIVTLNLTLLPNDSSSLSVSACNSWFWPDAQTTYTTSGNYMTSIPAANGCDSVISLALTVNSPDTTVQVLNTFTLMANNDNATYQWIDCNNNYNPIPGDTNQWITSYELGSYAVIVTENGCSDTSACYQLEYSGLEENSLNIDYKLFPNPTKELVTITFGQQHESIKLELINALGQKLSSKSFTNVNSIEYKVRFAPGYYNFRLTTPENSRGVNIPIIKL